jgi:hypothetical protein
MKHSVALGYMSQNSYWPMCQCMYIFLSDYFLIYKFENKMEC